jgi:tRNA1(Val) A37 N6-methylase TrmN6
MYTIYSQAEWEDINNQCSKDEIKELIWEITRSKPLPLNEISEEGAELDFSKLSSMDCRPLIKRSQIFSRYEYRYDIGDTYIDSCNIGSKSSNYFHQQLRYRCDSINSPSPERTWTNKKFFFSMLGALWTLKCKDVTSDTLRTCISMRKYVASQFRPSAAKAIYQHFGAERVLDFSSGWGDRLSAAMATDSITKYVGIDPNTELFSGYKKQISKFGNGKDIEMVNLPAEDYFKDSRKDIFDLVLTSPPYFVIERYSKDATQSWVRYKKIDMWLRYFLFPVVSACCERLRSGGHLAINISDVYCNHTVNNICDPMNDLLSGIGGMEKIENINYRMAKRIRSKSDKGGIFVEPFWIWRKI